MNSSGDLLLFLDADIRFQDHAIMRLVETHRRLGGIISVQPYLNAGRFSERLSLFFYLVAAFSISLLSRNEGMFGACFLISRRDYERLGGHKEVFNELIEDVVLAEKAGLFGIIKVHNFAGKGVVTASLYPDGFKNVIEGWSKTFPLGARLISSFSFLLVFLWVSGVISSEIMLFKGENPGFYLIYAVQIFIAARMLGDFGIFLPIFHFVPSAFFVMVFFFAAVKLLIAGKVSWKGRIIMIREKRSK